MSSNETHKTYVSANKILPEITMQGIILAIILGESSYGKGSVQSIIPLRNGGGMRLTISKYYLPSGNSISEIGVAPDIVVEEIGDDFKINSENDNQLKYALKLFNS